VSSYNRVASNETARKRSKYLIHEKILFFLKRSNMITQGRINNNEGARLTTTNEQIVNITNGI
jgi:hypothetical protein